MTEQIEQPQIQTVKLCTLELAPSERKLYLAFESNFLNHLKASSASEIDSFIHDFSRLMLNSLSTIKAEPEKISESEIVNKDA